MLLTLLYHRIAQGKYANTLDMMKAHFEHLAKNYPVVLPGEPLRWMQTQVCLTFDDAFFDFFHRVYPLLREYKLRAILAVPTKFIIERTTLSPEIRLQVPLKQALKEYHTKAPYCTWEEIQEMVASGLVQVASHSHSHLPMTTPGLDLDQEILGSKKLLEEKLQTKVSTFVYPYGNFNAKVQRCVLKHYTHAMRIGRAVNPSWGPLVYRVHTDSLQSPDAPFKASQYIQYWLNTAIHRLRNR